MKDNYTHSTTPFWNCPTLTLENKIERITVLIDKVNSISGDELGYLESSELTSMLIELKKSLTNQVAIRKQANR